MAVMAGVAVSVGTAGWVGVGVLEKGFGRRASCGPIFGKTTSARPMRTMTMIPTVKIRPGFLVKFFVFMRDDLLAEPSIRMDYEYCSTIVKQRVWVTTKRRWWYNKSNRRGAEKQKISQKTRHQGTMDTKEESFKPVERRHAINFYNYRYERSRKECHRSAGSSGGRGCAWQGEKAVGHGEPERVHLSNHGCGYGRGVHAVLEREKPGSGGGENQ